MAQVLVCMSPGGEFEMPDILILAIFAGSVGLVVLLLYCCSTQVDAEQ